MDGLSTQNVWIDTVVAAAIPFVIHLFMPDKSLSGNLGWDVLLLASIPLFRAKWGVFQEHVRAGGMDLFCRLRNKYETTIRFEKKVRPPDTVELTTRRAAQNTRRRSIRV